MALSTACINSSHHNFITTEAPPLQAEFYDNVNNYFLNHDTPIPNFFSYTDATTASAIPLIADKVALPTTIKTVDMLTVLPPRSI